MSLPVYRPARSESGAHPSVNEYVAGAAITEGYFVKLSTDGKIDENSATALTAEGVLGIALNAAAADGDAVRVLEATPDQVFSGAVAIGTWSQASVGDVVNIHQTGLDIASPTQPMAKILSLDPTDDDPSGTRRVLFSVDPTHSQAPGGLKAAT